MIKWIPLLRLETQKRRNDKEVAEKQKKEKANQAKLKRDQAVEDLKKACLQGPPFFGGNRSAENKSCMNCTCGNNVVVLDPQNTDEKWIGCPQECGYWSCYLVTCQKMMDKHRQICHLRLFPWDIIYAVYFNHIRHILLNRRPFVYVLCSEKYSRWVKFLWYLTRMINIETNKGS